MIFLAFTDFIGRFHPVLVHLPIGFLMIGLLLQWLSAREQYHISREVIKIVFLLGMLSAIVACITGYLLSLSGEYEEDLKDWHMWMGIGVAVVSIIMYGSLVLRIFNIQYKILPFVLLSLIIVTGHLGGSLTHGPDYLTEGWATPFDTTAMTPRRNIPNIQEAVVYTDIVQPLLQSKCYSCHGEKRQKNKLRLDGPEWIKKGSKNGPVIHGKEDESELVKRISLPREDDDHMPPRQKPQLKEEEVAVLHWWVDQGADFTKKVKELKAPETLKSYLLSLQNDQAEEKKLPPIIPSDPVERADEKAVLALKNRGVVIIPVAKNSNYLTANFITALNSSDADMNLLLPLKKQLTWLKLNGTNISDSALTIISQCSNLTQLQLNNTKITDRGLAELKTLGKLQTLSVIGTKVTGQGVMQLQSLKGLQSIYLFHTKVNINDWLRLKKAFPKTALDTGGYTVPALSIDTIEAKPKPRQ